MSPPMGDAKDSSKETLTNPIESLEKFLSIDSSSLLIRGAAGTGKTTLALRVLNQSGRKQGVYISSRLSREKITSQLPPEKGRFKNEQFVDLRFEDAASVLQKVTLARQNADVSGIVLDSWDAFANELEEIERLKTEKMLLSFAVETNKHLVLVSEVPTASTMDYLVDGVVELSRTELDGRVIREISINKLRGTVVDQYRHIVSLAGGEFVEYQPYSDPDYSKVRRLKPREDPKSAYSFGNSDMDRVFGGLGPGTTFTFEYDENVPYGALRAIELCMIQNFLQLGRAALLLPLPGAFQEKLYDIVSTAAGKAAVKQFSILNQAGSGSGSTAFPKGVTPRRMHDIVTKSMTKSRRGSRDKGVLLVKCVSALENVFASDLDGLLQVMSERITSVQQSRDAYVLFLQSDSPIRSRILSMSSNSAKIFTKNGTVLLAGVKPHTGIFVLENDENPIIPTLSPVV